MFLFCNWFNSSKEDKVYRSDLEDLLEELLNLKGDE